MPSGLSGMPKLGKVLDDAAQQIVEHLTRNLFQVGQRLEEDLHRHYEHFDIVGHELHVLKVSVE